MVSLPRRKRAKKSHPGKPSAFRRHPSRKRLAFPCPTFCSNPAATQLTSLGQPCISANKMLLLVIMQLHAVWAYSLDVDRLAGTAMDKSRYSDENQVLLTLLRRMRQRRRLRQVDLANLIGRDQALVSKVESGDRRLDLVELRTWLRAMDVDFMAFMKEFHDKAG